jgi:hypothetical protein
MSQSRRTLDLSSMSCYRPAGIGIENPTGPVLFPACHPGENSEDRKTRRGLANRLEFDESSER